MRTGYFSLVTIGNQTQGLTPDTRFALPLQTAT